MQIEEKVMKRFKKDPLFYIEKAFGFTPQTAKPEYAEFVKTAMPNELKVKHFGTLDQDTGRYKWYDFQLGKHITWHQFQYFRALECGARGILPKRITVRSGHGVGKTRAMSLSTYWGLFCHRDAQIACTAPTEAQMYDILWKENEKCLQLIDPDIRQMFNLKNNRLEVKISPKTWFARARTGKKENVEALSGIHGTFVMNKADEASGVYDQIFNTMEGALTDIGGEYFVVLISNPTRITGYFFDSHHSDRENWQALHFNSIESPLVDWKYEERIRSKHGEESDEYSFRVLGEFPSTEGMDDKGYVPLLTENDIRYSPAFDLQPNARLGIDCAGAGKNKTTWIGRDAFKAKILGEEAISDPKSIAAKTLTFVEEFGFKEENIYVDNLGVGANMTKEMALSYLKLNINGVNVGDPAEESERFLNKRAEVAWRSREWLKKGGALSNDKRWKEALLIRFKHNIKGKLQIMSKDEMRREGIKSPDYWDGFALTFWDEDDFSDDKDLERENVALLDELNDMESM